HQLEAFYFMWTYFLFYDLLVLLLALTAAVFLKSDLTDWLWLQDQNSCACGKRLSKDNLRALHRLNHSVEPFLTVNTNLSEEAFRWWTVRENNASLFSSHPSSDSCRTCAVVGNSANLKGSRYRSLIDYQDVVIRMNAAPTKNYESDVGTKTTHRVMYPESAVDLDNSTLLVLFPFKINDLQWVIKAITTGFYGRSYVPIKFKIKANKDLVMVVNTGFMRYVHEIWLKKKGDYPFTGFMALILALQICDEVSVFGYGADDDGNWSHYFETLKSKNFKTGPHPGKHEYAIIDEVAQNKTIRLYNKW
uniref:ST3 beta-galactoside alpha-2,3-sialyltransferase 1 n=1 Tax=Xiphophorus couchianus TaxID=32473 RepID=A0A3B5L9I2_9TELE